MKISLAELKILIENLAQKINAPQTLLPTYGNSIDGAHPHIEVDMNGQLYYVIVERGEELKRDFAADTNDLLFRVFSSVTFSMAIYFEVNNRIKTEDGRRKIFSKQEELLSMLDMDWKTRIEKDHQWILRTHPFDDFASIRAHYCKQLTDKGTESWIAWDEACKKYPIPKPS